MKTILAIFVTLAIVFGITANANAGRTLSHSSSAFKGASSGRTAYHGTFVRHVRPAHRVRRAHTRSRWASRWRGYGRHRVIIRSRNRIHR